MQGGSLKFVNDAACEFYEYARQEVEKWTLDDFIKIIHPDDRQKVISTQKNFLNETIGAELKYAGRIISKSGKEKWADTYAKIITYRGKVASLISFVDITGLIEAEQKLKESEENYRSLYNNAEVGLFQTRVSDGKMLASNQNCAEMLGYDDTDQFLKEYIVAEHYVDPSVRATMINKIKNDGFVKNYEAEVTDRHGIPHWWSYSARLYPEQGMIEGVLIDISERKNAENELKRIEWLLESKPIQEQIRAPEYGDLTELNEQNVILKMVGKEVLYDIVTDYLDLLETSAAVYEKNGDYALGIFTSGYCRFLDKASRKLCNTNDNLMALNCGSWHCHESCWNKTSKKSIELGQSFENECDGGLHIFATPIWANNEIVGSINIGYGDPPSNDIKLQEIAEKYDVNVDKLKEISKSYESHPVWMTDMAKNKLLTSAKLIGEIIERKIAEQKLKQSEERMKLFMDSSTDGFVLFDSKLNYVDVNEVTLRILGITKEELIGKNILDMAPNLKETGRYDKYLDVIKTGKSFSTDDVIYDKQDGSLESYFSVRAFKVGDDLGIIFTDITERKKVDEALKASELLLQKSQIIGQIGSFEMDLATNDVVWSDQLYKLFGLKKEGRIIDYEKVLALIHPDDRERAIKVSSDAAKELKPYTLEHRVIHPDGRILNLLITGDIIRNEKNEIVKIGGTTQDITERKKAEQKLKDSEERLNIFMESAPNTFMLYDSDLNLININNIGIKRFPAGTKKEEIIGKNIVELSPDVKKKGRYDEYMEVIKTGKPLDIEEFIAHPKFGNVHISLNAFKVLNGLGITARDVTEAKKAEIKLKESEEKWKALSENSPAHITLLDREHKILFINRTVPDLTKEDVIGTSVYLFVPKEFHQITRDSFNSVWETGEPVTYTTNYITKEGDIRFFDVWIGPVFQSGKISALVSHSMDVTVSKKAEEKIKYQAKLVEIVSDAIISFDMNLKILSWNKAAENTFGWKANEVIGKYLREVIPVEFPYDNGEEVMKELLDNGYWSGEGIQYHKNNTPINMFSSSSIIEDIDGKQIGIVTISRDITERKEAEKIISDLAKFPSENPNPILRVTKDRVIYANKSAQELFNVYKGEIIPDLLRQSVNNVVNESLARNLELVLQNQIYSFDITPLEDKNYVNIYGRDITKQKKAIKRIEDLARFPEENPNPIFRATKDRVIYANQACQEVFHIHSSEILPQLFVGIVNKALNENLAKAIEIQHNNRIFSLSVTPIKNTNYANIYVIDSTERKKAEKKIQDQANIIETVSDAIIITDLNFNINSWNRGAEQIYGWKRSEIIGKSVPQILKTTLLNETVDVASKKISEEGYWKGEAIQERKDGKKIVVLNATTLIKDDDGNPIGTVGVNRDISERKKIQQELEEAEIRYRTTFEQSPDILLILDPETQKAVEFNDSICELLGYTREEFANLQVSDYDANENPEEVKTHIENILKKGYEDFETKFKTKNGEIKDIYARIKVIVLGDKKFFESIGRDITERKKAEGDLKKSEKKLRERVKELNCLYGLSKLIETPDISIDDVIEKALDLIPPAWQFPDITCSRIIYKEKEFKTANFVKTKWKQKAEIRESEEKIGSVEVYYLKKILKFEDGPFLKEERNLIKGFAEILGRFFERKEVELSINQLNLELEQKVIKRTEKLKKSEEKYRNVVNNLDVGFYKGVYKGKLLMHNQALNKIIGLKPDESIVGLESSQFFIDAEIQEKYYTELEEKGFVKDFVAKIRNFKEEVIIVDINAHVTYNSEGEPIEVEGTFVDITEKNKLQQDLLESEKKFRKMIRNLDFGYYNITYSGKIVFHNPAFNIIFGFDPSEDLTGMSALDMWYNPTDRQQYLKELEQNNSIIDFIFQGKKENKEMILLESNSHLSRDKNGNPTNVEGTVIDVTDKFKLEQNLKEQNIRLREINDFKTNLLNRTSHELQTPLISIKGFTDILLDKYENKLDQNMVEYLEIINTNANRLVKIIRAMIDSAYYEKERLNINVYLEDLAHLIRDCIKNYNRLIKLRNHSIDMDVQDVLITKFDKNQIYRVFESLLENAINNTPTGGKIQVHTKTQEDSIIVSITDNGVGLTREEIKQLFQPFGKIERYGNGKDVVIEGPGLSLYICKKIVELHGGKIWVESKGKDKGATFYFSIPIIAE